MFKTSLLWHSGMVGEMVQNSQSLHSCYCYSRIYLFTFNNRIYFQEIYLVTFNGIFLIHDYMCSHLRDVFIHIQRVIFIHIHDRNINHIQGETKDLQC